MEHVWIPVCIFVVMFGVIGLGVISIIQTSEAETGQRCYVKYYKNPALDPNGDEKLEKEINEFIRQYHRQARFVYIAVNDYAQHDLWLSICK